MNDTTDTISLEIEASAKSTNDSLSKLIGDLKELRTLIDDMGNVKSLSNLFGELKNNTSGSFRNVNNLSKYLSNLKSSSSGLDKVSQDLKSLQSVSDSLSTLTNIGDAKGLKSIMKQLSTLPTIAESLDDKTIDEFTEKINKLTEALTPLATQVEKVTVGFNKLPSKVKSVNNYLENNNKKTKSGTSLWSAFTKGISGSIVKLKIMGTTAMNTGEKLADVVQDATKYEEALNLFMVSMGEQAPQASAWVQKFSKALYLDDSNVMQYMGSLNSLISGLGVGAEKSYLMSRNLTQLSYDLASFKNMKFEEAFRKIQSGISGEIEPLRNVGVALSQNTLQELANSLGIQQRVADMTEAQKAQLRYIQILKSTTQWQGDMGRTLISPSNAIRVLREQFTLLGRAIGRVFVPMIMQALPYVMALTEILTELANKLAGFLGYKFTDIDYSSVGKLETGIKDIGTAADDTKNKLNTMLAPFDELNVVQTKTQNAGAGVGGLGGDLGVDLPSYDALAGLTDKFKKNIENAKKNLKNVFEIAKKLALVFGSLWVLDKIVKFINHMKTLSSVTSKSKGLFDLLAKSVMNAMTRFKKGKEVGGLLGGLKAMFPWLTKTNVGLGTLAIGLINSYNAAKKAADGTKDVDNQIKKFWASTAAMTAGGALIAGPWGALAGAIASVGVSLIGLGVGYSKAQKELAKQEVFGSLTVSTESFKNMLDNLNVTIPTSSTKLMELTNTIKNTAESFDENSMSVQRYLYQFGTLGQSITDEAVPQIKASLESLFTDANTIIDTGTQKSLQLWSDTFMGMTGVTKEEQTNVLNNITENGTFQKKTIKKAQDDIYTIWDNAMQERRSLTEGEYKKIQELLGIIQEYTENSITASESKLTVLKTQFNDKNQKLDEQSYENFKKARDNYQKEQEESIDAHYNAMLNDAEKQYKLTLDRLIQQGVDEETAMAKANEVKKRLEADAYDSYLQLQTNYKTKTNEFTDSVVASLRERYEQLKTSNIDGASQQRKIIEDMFKKLNIPLNPIKENFATAGTAAGGAFANGLQGKLNTIKPQMKVQIKPISGGGAAGAFFNAANIQIPAYASGGFPETGEFFMARENGAEMVGRIGNKTAIANNDQITTSITNALISALSSFNFGNNQPSTTVVNIGGKKVYEGVGDYVDSENDRYGTSYVHV